ncbi:hypothetical protein, partial [Streptomyces sp. Ru87]|uniref:hypothetical protein n=1 Tax=Streptomyces sp. Ru87 TaxID=2044307 RepID=UPI000C017AD1
PRPAPAPDTPHAGHTARRTHRTAAHPAAAHDTAADGTAADGTAAHPHRADRTRRTNEEKTP